MNKISDRIQKLPASATLAMAAKARELKSKGIDIIGLSLGEPDFNTPEFIKKPLFKLWKITIIHILLLMVIRI